MKINSLLNEIYKGLWLLDYTAYHEYFELYQKLLSGAKVFESKESLPPKIYTGLGLQEYESFSSRSETTSGEKKVAIVTMRGLIIKYSDMCTIGAEEIVEQLDILNKDPNVEATILRMDGPGGSLGAISPFLDFGLRKKKPVVGLFDNLLSLYYWAALGCCDYLMAENTISSRVGSVGVVLSFSDYSEKRKKEGIIDHEIYPAESEHKNIAFKLALKGEYEMITQEMLTPIAIKYQNYVRAKRPNLKEKTGVLTGKTFGAEDAIELGMIDGIGNLQDAVNIAKVLAELKQF